MSVRRIIRVYYDLDNYVKPKEVEKVFRMMDKRSRFMARIEEAIREVTKQGLRDELSVLNGELELLMQLVAPKGCNWGLVKHSTETKNFWVLTISETISDPLKFTGQDDE